MREQIASPGKTKEILKKHGFYFQKKFGQNFLIDLHVLQKIVQAPPVTKEDCVLEIGPGIGSLTEVLAEHAKKVIAVEIDRNLIPILGDTLQAYDNIRIINEDILKVDIEELIEEENQGKPIKVVANLPYYITTPIIMGLLERRLPVDSITVMIQKEVAERMGAGPGSKDYGALSIAVQYYCKTELVANVPPNCFMPRPKVGSAVIKLNVLSTPRVTVKDEALLFRLIKAAFGQRRKTLINSLYSQAGLSLEKSELGTILKNIGLDERVRGEALTLEEFAVLADQVYETLKDRDM